MDLEVDYLKLLDVSLKAEKELDKLNARINELQRIVNELEGCWEGDSYAEFKENASVFLNNLITRKDELLFLARFARYASDIYSNNDSRWAERMKQYREENIWQRLL